MDQYRFQNQIPEEILLQSKRVPTFIIFYQPNNIIPPNPEKLKLIMKIQAGNSEYYYRLFQVIDH